MGLDLSGNPVREIRHLPGYASAGRFFFENTRVESLIELGEANLVELRLNNSPIKSLRGLEGQPLENLYAVGTQITEVSPISSSNLRQLWLSESPVSDVSGLAGLLGQPDPPSHSGGRPFLCPKAPGFAKVAYRRNPYFRSDPLEGLNVTRLVFTPPSIKRSFRCSGSSQQEGNRNLL